MDANSERISIIVPCFNEVNYIAKALESILNQSYPDHLIEIFVIDGCSTDGTRAIIAPYLQAYKRIKLIDNPNRTAPYALNLGLNAARGEMIARMDVHSTYPINYLQKLCEALKSFDADNVGGAFITLPGANTKIAHAIAAAMTHPFGIGNSMHRTGIAKSREVDTVPYGFYRRDVFERIGQFDTALTRNQDDELNARLRQSGGKIVMVAGLNIGYHARPTLGKLWSMFYQYGLFKPLVNKKLGRASTLRQFAPPLLIVSLLAAISWMLFGRFLRFLPLVALLICYFSVAIAVSFKLGRILAKKGSAIFLPQVFTCIHLAYGLGYWQGIFKFLLLRNREASDVVSRR